MTYQTTTGVSEHLRQIASDPMWADHAEVRKETLIKAASAIEVLARLLNSYVCADEDTRHDGFDTSIGVDDFPDKDEARKAEAVAILRTLTAQPRAVA
jgi:hypothetical protein